MKIVLTGGGTGGHILPLIAVAKKIKEKDPSAEFLFVGTNGGLEEKIMKEEGIKTRIILSGKLRRYFSFLNFVDFFKIGIGVIQSLWILFWNMPDAIFSKGGFASFPVVFVSWVYQIPSLIHESDANPGMANSVLAKFSNRVAVSYPRAEIYFPAEQVVFTGNPLREDIAQGNPQNALEKFSFSKDRKTIFIWGGSQGSQIINKSILDILPKLIEKYQIIHQTGVKNFEDMQKIIGEIGLKLAEIKNVYCPIDFIGKELKDILALSDLVISRAGSNSISEIAANGKPAIIIPIEKSANDHQRMNAYIVAKNGGCVVLEEANLGGNILLKKIEEILTNESLNQKMRTNIKIFYRPDAAEKIAEGIFGMLE